MRIQKLICTFFSVVFCAYSVQAAEINLQEAVSAAYENNPELRAQNYSVAAAKSQKQKSYGGFLPNVSADLNSGTQNTKVNEGFTLKGAANKKTIGLSQDLFNGGGTYFDIKRAGSVVSRENSLKDAKEQEIILNVIEAYLNILRFEELVKIERDNLESQKRVLDYTQKKLSAKDATKSEFAKANADYLTASSTRVAVENNLVSAKATFTKLTGIEINKIGALKNVSDENFYKNISKLNSETLFELALQNNPEIKAAQYGLDSAKYQSSMSKSSMLPSVKLTMSASEEKNPLYYNNQEYRNNSVYVNLHVPIFSSGVEYANISETNNIMNREKYNLDGVRVKVRQQIVEFLNKIKSFHSQYESVKEQEAANEVYVMTLGEEERLGTKSIIDLLRANQELYIARVSRVNLSYDKVLAIFNLKNLVGGLTYGSLNAGNILNDFTLAQESQLVTVVTSELPVKAAIAEERKVVEEIKVVEEVKSGEKKVFRLRQP